MSVTPETLTFEDIKKWTPQEMRENMRHFDMREAITRVVSSQPLDAVLDADKAAKEAAAQQEQTVIETPEQAAQKVAEELAAQQARLAEQRIASEQEEARKVAETPKKIVVEYQVKDEDGNPIGRPTHLEATTEEEMRGKIIEAHIQATRAFHRLKKQKISFKDQQPIVASTADADLLTAMADLRSEDPNKQLAALRKVQQAESDKLRAEEAEQKRQAKVSQDFLKAHKEDFYNCQANIELIKEYFEQNPELNWTYDNLELAFLAVEPKLAPVPRPEPASVIVVNPQPTASVAQPTQVVAPVVQQPVVQQPVQAVVPTPVVAAPANNTPVSASRPGVNGGIVPGESSASRPATKSTGLTAEEIRSWSPAEMRTHMRNPAKRAQIEAFFEARNQVRK